MGPIEALEIAKAKEVEAMKMYESYSLKFPSAKDIFSFLMNEEQKHKQLIEKKIVELTA